MGSCATDEGLDSSGYLFWILVFPGPDDLPTSLSQLRVGISVSAPIGLDLPTPEVCIAGGPGCVLGAAVPEATIDEDGHPSSGEGNVDAPAFVGQDWGIHSVTEATRVQRSPDLHLGRRASSPDLLHPTTGFSRRWLHRLRVGPSEGQAAISCASVVIDSRWA